MIVMIVAYKDKVDFWQLFKRNEGRAHAFGTNSRKWATAFGKHRIDKNVNAHDLDQDRSVAKKGNFQALITIFQWWARRIFR